MSTDLVVFQSLLLRQLAKGDGLDALVRTASDYLGSPITACDAAYMLLSTCPVHNTDGVFVLQQSQRYAMRPEIVAEMQEKGITQQLRQTKKAFRLYNAECSQWEVFCAISGRGQILGYLFQRTETEPNEAFLTCWTALAEGIAAELQKDLPLAPAAGQTMQERLLRQLIEGQLTDEALTRSRLAQSGWHANAPYRISCLFAPDTSLFAAQRPDQLFRQLQELLPGCLCCAKQESAVLLSASGLSSPLEPTRLIRLRHWLHYYHLQLAVSLPFNALTDAAAAYVQASGILHIAGHITPPESSIFYFEEVLPVSAFLSSCGADRITQQLHPHIQCFLAHDRAHRTNYIDTLAAYFAASRNMTETSRALFIHKTTLFYRFERMEKLVGPFLHSPRLLFLYEYSLTLLRRIAP